MFLTYLCPILKTDCTSVHYHCYCYLSMCYVVISFRSLFHLCCFSRLLSFFGGVFFVVVFFLFLFWCEVFVAQVPGNIFAQGFEAVPLVCPGHC